MERWRNTIQCMHSGLCCMAEAAATLMVGDNIFHSLPAYPAESSSSTSQRAYCSIVLLSD